MKYISTRGETEPVGFVDAVLEGLAPDGGLLIPEKIPEVHNKLDYWMTLSYQDITFEVMRLFVDMPELKLKRLIDRSYMAFRHPEIAPAIPVGPIQILELFWGPTLAFKDIALQFLGNFFEYALDQRDLQLNILAATSGDTGSAAIQGVRGCDRINIFVMHPEGRIAPLQEKQMTSVMAPNVFNIAIEGTFDDCQRIMKHIFGDVEFKKENSLGAVNSVNWARVMAQIVYYFSAGLYVMDQNNSDKVSFSVPTGNFGDILAGYYAWKMGLPISKLVLATNENDILSRFFNTGVYSEGEVASTLSPSMDIQVASNFERYLYYLMNEDGNKLTKLMGEFDEKKEIRIPFEEDQPLDDPIVAGVGTSNDTVNMIRKYYKEYDYILDPHTAVGVSVGEKHLEDDVPMICLATAHPAKFRLAIKKAIQREVSHEITDAVMHSPTRCEVLPPDEKAVQDFLKKNALI
ncbi:MAG: threonine synthase [Verrucomicrobiota bacterium]